MISVPLDVVPLWCFFVAATAIGMLAVEGGYRFGKWRHVNARDEKDGPVGAMVGSILGKEENTTGPCLTANRLRPYTSGEASRTSGRL